jgi:molybdopterin molybdotransferase
VISVAEASAGILERIQRLPAVAVDTERCLGRVLADRVVAPVTSPPWDNSSMDGYAVRSSDLDGRPLRVVGTIAAGAFPSRGINSGEAMRIMTGAPVPAGADGVIRKEDTDGGLELVTVHHSRDAGRNIRRAGEDFRAGDVLFDAGDQLSIGHVGALAAAGIKSVNVHRAPRVAIISSGDELIELGDFTADQAGNKIVSANSVTLGALIRETGADFVNLGIATDTAESMRDILGNARGFDLIVTTAGISVGDHDHVRDSVLALGGEIDFWKVRMRPGAPLAFGMLHAAPWIGLSGNPVSAVVTFEVFVKPAIRKMMGFARVFPRTLRVTLDEPIRLAAPLMHFLRVVLTQRTDGSYGARLAGSQSSGVMTSLARANALLIIPGDQLDLNPGDQHVAMPLGHNLEMASSLDLT